MNERKNAGYTIVNAIEICGGEVVLGVNELNPCKYVTWECTNGTNYFWGHYFTDLLTAQKDFCKRGYDIADRYLEIRKSQQELNVER